MVTLIALTASTAAFSQGKVAVFNMQAAVMQTDAAQKHLQALDSNADFSAMKAKFENLRAELIKLDADAKTNQMTWSNDQKADFKKKVEYKSADLKLSAEKLKSERNVVMQKIMKELGPKTKTVLNQLVTAENIGLVLDSSAAYYATADFDITAKVTEKLNKAQ
jgi:outer membrane protein